MNNLDNALEDILCFEMCCYWSEEDGERHPQIDKIKQAFMDDGWVKLPLIRGAKIENEMDVLRLLEDENKFMYEKSINSITGAEWYNKFVKEIESHQYFSQREKAYKLIMDCAKKASDIE